MTTAREELEAHLDTWNAGPGQRACVQSLLDAALAEARAEGYEAAKEEACNFEHIRLQDTPYCAVCNSHERKWSKP